MAWHDDVEEKVREYLNEQVEIIDTSTIPKPEDVPYNRKVKRVEWMITMYVDIRNSTQFLHSDDQKTAGRVHKGFMHLAVKCIKANGGQVRSFDGDSVLAFWAWENESTMGAVKKAAFDINGLYFNKLKSDFAQYGNFDFGIGVDLGDVIIARAGTSRQSTDNDLIFLGLSVNRAVAIGNQAHGPSRIEFTSLAHRNLPDDCKINSKTGEDMWTDGHVDFKGSRISTKCSSWGTSFD